MLQWIRDKSQGVIALIIVAVLCLAFGLWGIHNYIGTSQHKTVVAKVNGHEITQNQLAQAFARFRAQNMKQHPEWFDSQQAVQQSRQTVLHNLVERYLMVQTAKQHGLRIGDGLLQQVLMNIPVFQQDGSFSKQRFQRFLAQMQMNQQSFLTMLRDQMLQNQMKLGIVQSAFTTPQQLTQIAHLTQQKRSLYYVIIDHKPLLSLGQVTQKQMHQYYQHNKKAYRIPKQVKLAYIKLTKQQIKHTIKPSHKQLKQYYDEHLEQFAKPERWHVAYLELSKDVAGDKAQHLYKQWKKGSKGKRLAQKSSKTTYHSDKVIKASDKQQSPWQQAVQGHQHINVVLKPFQVDGGKWVIAKITQHKEETAPSFGAIKDQVKHAYIESEADKKLSQKVNKLANLTFQHANSLRPAANQLGVKIHTTSYFKQSDKDFKNGLLHYKQVRQAGFSDEVVKSHNNSDVINLGNNSVVVVRANDIKPEHTRSFEQVKSQIKHKVAQLNASRLARRIAQIWQEQIDSSHSLKALIRHNPTLDVQSLDNVGHSYGSKQVATIVQHGFQLMRPTKNHASTGVSTLNNGDAALIQLRSVHTPSISSDDINKQQKQLIQRGLGALEFNLYQQAIKNKASITYKS